MIGHKRFKLAELDDCARKVFQILDKENDLSGVVVAVALLDEYLRLMLAKVFRKGGTADRLLSPNGALGGFSNRAALAYCLQLLPVDLYRDTEAIGRVRNLFAHSPFQLTFENSDVQKACAQLSGWKFLEELWPSAKPADPSANLAAFEAKMRFNGSVAMIANNLVLVTAFMPEVESPQVESVD